MIQDNHIGYIYILTNPAFKEYVKIGYADDVQRRLKELNRSECVPFAFRLFATYQVNERLQDKTIHDMIDKINPSLRAIDSFEGKQRIREFFEMSADTAYSIFEAVAKLNGTTDRLKKYTPEGHEIIDEEFADSVENKQTYTELELLANRNQNIVQLYKKLKESILKIGTVTIQPRKYYVAFKKSTHNIADIEIQKDKLKLYINMTKGTLDDPDFKTQDISNTGHWGNGDYITYIFDDTDIDYAIGLVKQSYDTVKSGNSNE